MGLTLIGAIDFMYFSLSVWLHFFIGQITSPRYVCMMQGISTVEDRVLILITVIINSSRLAVLLMQRY